MSEIPPDKVQTHGICSRDRLLDLDTAYGSRSTDDEARSLVEWWSVTDE